MNRTILGFAFATAFLAPASAQAPSNDECANAIVVFDGINPGAPSGLSGFTFTNVNATESAGAASCLPANPGTSDVWFLYVATSNGPCAFQTCTPAGFANGTLSDTEVEVYDACGGIRLACDDDACSIQGLGSSAVVTVTAGLTYVVRMASYSTSNTVEGTFYLSIAPTLVPPGDDCGTSSAFITLDGIYLGTTTGATPIAAPPPTSPCTVITATMVDVWFFYIAPASGVATFSKENTDSTATNGLDVTGATAMEMYDATTGCFGWTSSLICSAALTNFLTTSVSAGSLYAIRLGVAPGAAQGSFTLSVSLLAAPGNDECSSASPVVDGTNPASGIYTNNAATDSSGFAAACAGGPAGSKDVWFSYIPAVSGTVTATTCDPSGALAGSLTDTILEVYSSCVPGAPIACGDDDPACGTKSTASFAVVGGSLYNLRVASKSTTAVGTFYVTLNPSPPNDDCVSAFPAVLGANGPFFHLGATTSAATQPACAASNNDLWFAFVAPSSGTLRADTCGSSFNTTLVVYAACNGAELACDNDDQLNRGPCAVSQTTASYLELSVVAGSTYYFRLGSATAILFGTSTLNLSYRFSFVVAPHPATSSVTLSNVAAQPGGFILNVVTAVQGAFPNGYLYGVDIPWGELFLLVATGPPFYVVAGPSGTYSTTLGGSGYPLGVTFYCVGIDLGFAGAPIGHTDPFSVTL